MAPRLLAAALAILSVCCQVSPVTGQEETAADSSVEADQVAAEMELQKNLLSRNGLWISLGVASLIATLLLVVYRQNRRSLAELADIHELAHTVNSTLDLDRVLSTAMSALQKRFPFNQKSVALIDEQRVNLVIKRLLGDFEPEAHQMVATFSIPLDEVESPFVRAVRTGQPFFLGEITPETVAAMSTHDRILYDTNPVNSLLILPLEVENEPVGVVCFGNTRKNIVLSRRRIAEIQRYMPFLAMALRNARLLDAAERDRSAAMEANRAKSRFLANMGHELKTPMNAIIGYSELLIEEAEETGSREVIPDLQRIHTSGKHLLEIISNILDLSKIEAGRMELHLERFELRPVLAESVATVTEQIAENGNELETHFADALGGVHADLSKVRQTVLSLLSNAAKFTREGRISVSAYRDKGAHGDRIIISVRDRGIGIAPDRLDRIFEAFSQGDESTTREFGGSGLGLPISRNYCRMMGGDLTAESELGKGSTFVIELPAEVNPPETPGDSGA